MCTRQCMFGYSSKAIIGMTNLFHCTTRALVSQRGAIFCFMKRVFSQVWQCLTKTKVYNPDQGMRLKIDTEGSTRM